MPAITVRNLTPEIHRALKARAAANGRSAEAEVRMILQDALFRTDQVGLGSQIHAIFADLDDFELDITRENTPDEPLDFSGHDYA